MWHPLKSRTISKSLKSQDCRYSKLKVLLSGRARFNTPFWRVQITDLEGCKLVFDVLLSGFEPDQRYSLYRVNLEPDICDWQLPSDEELARLRYRRARSRQRQR